MVTKPLCGTVGDGGGGEGGHPREMGRRGWVGPRPACEDPPNLLLILSSPPDLRIESHACMTATWHVPDTCNNKHVHYVLQ